MSENTNNAQWFTVQVMSGKEGNVRKLIEARHAKHVEDGVDDGFLELIIPTVKVVVRRDGKTIEKEQKCYPGYVFVHASIYDEKGAVIPEHWQFIRDTRGVISFLGGDNPIALSEEEYQALLPKQEEDQKARPENAWKVGEAVIVKEGPFQGFEGVIEDVDDEHHRLKVSVAIFGRSTLCETDFWQVDRA